MRSNTMSDSGNSALPKQLRSGTSSVTQTEQDSPAQSGQYRSIERTMPIVDKRVSSSTIARDVAKILHETLRHGGSMKSCQRGANATKLTKGSLPTGSNAISTPLTWQDIPELIQQVKTGLISSGMLIDCTLPGK